MDQKIKKIEIFNKEKSKMKNSGHICILSCVCVFVCLEGDILIFGFLHKRTGSFLNIQF